MYTLYNNIVSDIFFHSGICVDFLGTHMISLVLFFRKPGVTLWLWVAFASAHINNDLVI
jgi:hypothetical protein